MSRINFKTSLIFPVLNESSSAELTIRSICNQKLKLNEIIIVDGGSTDGTVELIRKEFRLLGLDSYRVFIKKGFNIAESRNFGASKANGDLLLFSDFGCVLDRFWVQEIVNAFWGSRADVVAGGYIVLGSSLFQKLSRNYFGLTRADLYKRNYLPSARSLAIKSDSWHRCKKFPEQLTIAAEDTLFNHFLIKDGFKIFCKPEAIVYWFQPNNLLSAFKKIYFYSLGDGESSIFLQINKGIHFGHSSLVFFLAARYLVTIILLFRSFILSSVFYFLINILPFWKLRKESDVKLIYYPYYLLIKFVLDTSVLIGFFNGFISFLASHANCYCFSQKRRKKY